MAQASRSLPQASQGNGGALLSALAHGADGFQAAFDNLVIGMAMVGLDGRWLRVNDAACRITGYAREELLELTFADITHPDDRELSRAQSRRLLAGEIPHYVLEKRYLRKDGSTVWVRISVALARDASGAPHMFVGALEDITAQKRYQHQQAGLRDTLELMAQGTPLTEVLASLVRLVEGSSTMGVMGSILLLDPHDRGRIIHGAAPSLPEAYNAAIHGLRIGPSAGSCGTAAYLNACVCVSDIASDPLWADYRDLALAHGLRACWSVPVAGSDGRVLGTFAMYYREPREPPDADRQLVSLVARTAAIAIERASADAVLRASEAKFAAAFGNSPLGLTLTSLDTGRLIEVNRGLLDVSGYTREELVGRTPEEVGLWVDPSERQRRFELLRKGRRPPDIEARFHIKDGRELTALVASTVIEVEGRPCVLTSVVDISDRKRAEQGLRESEARQRFLLELNAHTQNLTDPEQIMAVTAERLGRHLDADRCAYAEVAADEDTVTITGDYTRGVPSMVGRTQLQYFGATVSRMLRDGETVVLNDVDADPLAPADLTVYRQTMIRAAIAVPLRKQGRLVAGMAVTHASPRTWRQEDLRLVELVVAGCWESIERARVVRRLAESETRARLALDVAGQGTWSWDLATDEVEADARCRELLGLDESLPHRADIMARLHPDDLARVDAAVRKAAEAGVGSYADEFRVVLPGGGERWLHVRAQIQEPDGGRRRTMLGTLLDVSSRKRTEQQLKDTDRRKDEFLAVLAHELRNPLAPLRNVLQTLRLTRGPDPLVEMMERQVDHVVRLVDDLLEVSRISRGKIDLRRQRIELGAVLRQVLEAATLPLAAASHRLRIELPEEPLVLHADPVRLAQVFSNLLNNAIKFTPAQGEITVRAWREGRNVAVSVRDTGAGIPPEMLGRVFEMFTQVDRTRDRTDGGLGIGLALARSLVTLHEGRIEARSGGPGHGSEFVVWLPLVPAPAAPAETGGDAVAPRAPHRVLVVDDNRDAADSLGMLLRALGADAHVVHSGREALVALETHRPQLLLLDLGMPEMDGFAVARHVRERRGNSVRLVALSGWGHELDRHRTRAAGFDDHLIKPADVKALRAVIAALDAPPAGAGGAHFSS
jgi:PAS domain S-box-containing protein